MSTLPPESFSAGLRTSKRFPMERKIRQVTGMRRQRSDEEALKRALGVQSQSRRQWKPELHYMRALERAHRGDRE